MSALSSASPLNRKELIQRAEQLSEKTVETLTTLTDQSKTLSAKCTFYRNLPSLHEGLRHDEIINFQRESQKFRFVADSFKEETKKTIQDIKKAMSASGLQKDPQLLREIAKIEGYLKDSPIFSESDRENSASIINRLVIRMNSEGA